MKKIPILIALCGLTLSGCDRHESAASYDDMQYSGSYVTAEEPYFESGTADFSEVVYEEAPIAESRSASSRVAPVRTGSADPVGTSEAPDTRKIIKTGNMGIRVSRIDEARRQVDSLVAIYRGYYAEENYNDGHVAELTMTIRMPAVHFDIFTAALEKGRGNVLYKNISALLMSIRLSRIRLSRCTA